LKKGIYFKYNKVFFFSLGIVYSYHPREKTLEPPPLPADVRTDFMVRVSGCPGKGWWDIPLLWNPEVSQDHFGGK